MDEKILFFRVCNNLAFNKMFYVWQWARKLGQTSDLTQAGLLERDLASAVLEFGLWSITLHVLTLDRTCGQKRTAYVLPLFPMKNHEG